MTYPLDEQKAAERWLSVLNEPDEADRELILSVIKKTNMAYYAGLDEGMRMVRECKEQISGGEPA